MKSEVFGVALFGAPYLYQSGDPYFHMKMNALGLRRGSPLICGLRHKAILANNYEYWLCDYDEETRYSIDQFKAENAEKRNPSYDCGENVELFKALAAMNNENDMEQIFISERGLYIRCLRNNANIDWLGKLRKATVEEIVEYFKNNEK